MAFDNTKYDVELNSVGYKIRDYNKGSLNSFVPRIGGGDQTETDFSLLRAKSLKNFAGGQLQRFWEDDTSFYGSEGLFPIYDDGVLYPVNAPVADDGLIGSSKAQCTATCVTKDYIYIASRTFNSPTNRIVRVEKDGTETVLTLPSNLTNSAWEITSITLHDNRIWISSPITGGWWQMALSSTTVSHVASGSMSVRHSVSYNGNLYVLTTNGTQIWRYTGNTTTKSSVLVGDTYRDQGDYRFDNMFVYNNRIMLARFDGLWTYDGIQLLIVEDQSGNTNEYNYYLPLSLKGYLYYFMPDGWYRYNGALVEKLYDKNEIGFPVHACVGKNRIWFAYVNSEYHFSSRYDRLMGYDYSSGDSVDGRVAVFDGKGLYTYGRTSTFVKNPGTDDVSDQGALDKIFWFDDTLFLTEYFEKTTGNEYFTIDTDEFNVTGQKDWRLITSIFDGDFPMIDKSMENIEIVLDGDLSAIDASDSISASVRNEDFDQAGEWDVLEDFLDLPDYKMQIHNTQPSGYGFRNIQFLLSGSTTAGYGLKQFIQRFLLCPELRWNWQFTALCYGDNAIEPLVLSDGTESSQSVNSLRGNLYNVALSEFPSLFVDFDQMNLDGDIDNSVLTLDLIDASLLRDSGGSYLPGLGSGGFLKIGSEIIFWTAKSGNTITLAKRGALGTTPASHTDGDKVFILYRVAVQLENEHIIMENDGAPASGEAKPSEITLKLMEV